MLSCLHKLCINSHIFVLLPLALSAAILFADSICKTVCMKRHINLMICSVYRQYGDGCEWFAKGILKWEIRKRVRMLSESC